MTSDVDVFVLVEAGGPEANDVEIEPFGGSGVEKRPGPENN